MNGKETKMVLPHPLRRNITDSRVNQSSVSCQPSESCHDQPIGSARERTCVEHDRCHQDESRCVELRIRFLALLDLPASGSRWKEIWKLLITHQWMQDRLERNARSALHGSNMSDQWVEDVKQDVIVRLAHKLRRIPDLRLDRTKAEAHFAGWLNTIILRDCRMSVRSLRRMHYRTLSLQGDRAMADQRTTNEDELDFKQAVNQLGEIEASVMRLRSQGYTIREVAATLGLSQSKTYRVIRRATAQVERRLCDEDRT